MAKRKNYIYLVEGEDEKKIIDTFKREMRLIQPGKVHVINVAQERLKASRLVTFGEHAVVILIFDTDCGDSRILEENIRLLKSRFNIDDVICIPQVRNLEDELKRSSDIKQLKELTNSKSNSDYKRDLLRITNLDKRFKAIHFNFEKFWRQIPKGAFANIENQSKKICLK